MSEPVGFKGQRIPQREYELNRLCEIMREQKVTSYLEIGLQRATTFHYIGQTLPPGALMVGIDLPGGRWGVKDGAGWITEVVNDLRANKHINAQAILGDSKDPKVIATANRLSPYDCVFIDGDHAYDAVKADWDNYGPMAQKMVVLHDIDTPAHPEMTPKKLEKYGVHRFWPKIKVIAPYEEIIDQDDRGMGIGVLFIEQPTEPAK